jgi:hypothetical protein
MDKTAARLESERNSSMVNHPLHYNKHPSGVECIDVIEHMSLNIGNAIKYLWRADHKGNTRQDMEKAIWYINREIGRRESLGEFDTTQPG